MNNSIQIPLVLSGRKFIVFRVRGFFSFFGLLMLAGGNVDAQGLNIKLIADQAEYLPNESLMIGVSIENFSGTPVILGQHHEWIQFLIQDIRGRPVVRNGAPPPGEVFIVPNTATTTRWIDLAPYFNVRQQGAYSITAQVKVRQWKQSIEAQSCRIQVVGGLELAARKFGLPDTFRENVPPEIRVFRLLRKRTDGRLLLYLRVAEENDYAVYNVQRLGPLVQLSPPEFQLDSEGQIHVFFRSGARSYTYCVADAQGQLQKRQTHQLYLGKRPAMRMNNKKALGINGGRRVFTRLDIPKTPEAPKHKLP